jgi:Bax protein
MTFNKSNILIFFSILITISVIILITNTSNYYQLTTQNDVKNKKEVIVKSTQMTINTIPDKIKIKEKSIPNFALIKDVKLKKETFFNYLFPMIVNKNIDILKERDLVKNSKNLTSEIISLCKYYRVKCNEADYKDKFLNKVHIIPASLTLAQAANESAWGTSRFAKKANNFFGQWCFSKGCGIVPASRNSDAEHEVKKFDTVNKSVNSYIRNLNSHPAYKKLRDIRNSENTFKGNDLAAGLSKYSERGQHYIDEIRAMINFNKLQKYDEKMFDYLGINL